MNWINKYINLGFSLKLVGLTLLFNYFTIAFNAIVSPEGSMYNAFLDQYLNYIQWIRLAIMHSSNVVAHTLGTDSYISGPQMMNIGPAIEVQIWLPCLGIGIISFWTSFIIINSGTLGKKLIWCFTGFVCICLINCCRIGLLLVSIDNAWKQNDALDHHDLFNIASYILIGLMMYAYSEDKTMLPTEKEIPVPTL